jgi:hypothetical protein
MSIAVHDLQEKIGKFLSEEMSRAQTRMCIKLELSHAAPGSRPEIVKLWAREDENDKPYFESLDYVDRLAADIFEMCEERADLYAMGGENLFKLRTFQHGGGRASYMFKIAAPSNGDDAGMANDLPANANGVLALEMRNNQFMMRMNKDMVAGTIGSLTRQLGDALEENRQLRTERAQLVAEINQNKAAESERELAVVRQAHSEGRKDLFVGKAVQLLPIFGSKLLEKTTGSGQGALPSIMSELGASLVSDPKRMAQIAASLTVTERALLGEAMRLANTTNEAKNEAKKSESKPADGASAPSNGVNPSSANATP